MAIQKIKIKRFLQEKNSKDCGPVCVRMVLDHFGINATTKDLAKKLSYSSMGTSLFDNGLLVRSYGLSATVVTANPTVFSADDCRKLKTQTAIRDHVRKLIVSKKRLLKSKDNLRKLESLIHEGGEIVTQIPTLTHITRAIDEGKPVIVLLYARAFGENEGGYHFVVVNGYDEKYVYLVNPLPESKLTKVPFAEFFYGLYTSTNVDVDNGSLLIVSK